MMLILFRSSSNRPYAGTAASADIALKIGEGHISKRSDSYGSKVI